MQIHRQPHPPACAPLPHQAPAPSEPATVAWTPPRVIGRRSIASGRGCGRRRASATRQPRRLTRRSRSVPSTNCERAEVFRQATAGRAGFGSARGARAPRTQPAATTAALAATPPTTEARHRPQSPPGRSPTSQGVRSPPEGDHRAAGREPPSRRRQAHEEPGPEARRTPGDETDRGNSRDRTHADSCVQESRERAHGITKTRRPRSTADPETSCSSWLRDRSWLGSRSAETARG